MCLGQVQGQRCPARLHGVACAQISRCHASLGCFTCPDCYLRKLSGGADPGSMPEGARATAEQTMLLRLSQGAEATGGSYSDFQMLERAFMASHGGLRGAVMPCDDSDVFMMFLSWLVIARDRALSLASCFRIAGSIMCKTGRPNLTKLGDVKAHYEDLIQ